MHSWWEIWIASGVDWFMGFFIPFSSNRFWLGCQFCVVYRPFPFSFVSFIVKLGWFDVVWQGVCVRLS